MHDATNKASLLLDFPIADLIPYINWNYFFIEWDIAGRYPEIFDHPTRGSHARELFADAQALLETMVVSANAAYKQFPARQLGDDILLRTCACCPTEVRLPMLRNQTTHFRSLADFVDPTHNFVTLFAIAIHNNESTEDDYRHLMAQILCDRLADAFSSYIQRDIERSTSVKSLPMAFGYPAAPDHSPKRIVFELLQAEKTLRMTLTDNYSMHPTSSCCGVVISHPNIEYFTVGYIGEDQIQDYCARTGLTPDDLRRLIPNNLLPLL